MIGMWTSRRIVVAEDTKTRKTIQVTVHRGLSRFSRRNGRHKRIDVLAAKMGLSPLRRERGQVHVFGRRFLRQTRFPAEKWTSPHPGCLGSGGERREFSEVRQWQSA